MTVTISREFATELNEMIEDAVEYVIREYASQGELVSGETAYKVVAAYAEAKVAQFEGLCD